MAVFDLNISVDDKSRLPTELWILVAHFVRERSDLATLCRLSKTFRSICMPLLYKTISIGVIRKDVAVHLLLYRMLQVSALSQTVTEFSALLYQGIVCDKWNRDKARPSFLRRCTCDSYERAMGDAIVSLHGLRSLKIICKLCAGSHSHDHLFKMDAPMLRQFTFYCFRSSKLFKNNGSEVSIVTVPFMSVITGLALGCEETRLYSLWNFDLYGGLVRGNNAFSHLKTLRHDGSDFSDFVLSRSPVERLCVSSRRYKLSRHYNVNVHFAIVRSPGTLTHLLSEDLSHWLPGHMMRNFEPYSHLTFVGTITGVHCEVRCIQTIDPRYKSSPSFQEQKAFRDMEALSALSNLTFMEINQHRAHQPSPGVFELAPMKKFTPTNRFMELLEKQHPLLRRVLLATRQELQGGPISNSYFILWEKNGAWTSRFVPRLEQWDLLYDKLDEFE